jgi:hypothetical protein
VHGRRGLNRVRLNGRFGGRALAPGTYEIVVVAKRGKTRRHVGRISIQVVPPGSRVRRPGSSPVFRCAAPAPGAQTSIPGVALFVSPPSANRGGRSQPQPATKQGPKGTPGRSGVLNAPPFHIGTGSGSVDMLLAVLLYGTLGVGGAVLLVYVVRFFRGAWNP